MNPATLHVVGLGPGDAQCLTPQARQVLHEARCVAGYHLYMDLVPPELLEGKTRISTGMRQEAERCAAAVDAALAFTPWPVWPWKPWRRAVWWVWCPLPWCRACPRCARRRPCWAHR